MFWSTQCLQLKGGAIGRASDLRFIGREFKSCLGTIAQWPWASYLHLFASGTKQYNLVPVKGQWCSEAGKMTVGLATHWPCVTDYGGSLKIHVREMSTAPKLTIGHGQPLTF